MRLTWFIVVAVAAVGCKDRQPAAKSADPAGATPGSASATGATPPPEPPPDKRFADESEDPLWDPWAVQAIKGAAPQLADVECRHNQCRVTVTAGTGPQLVDASERAQTALMTVAEARSVKTLPTDAGVTIYVYFDRHLPEE